MILRKEQIERYLRHIIMPEISGPGQKKLLESRIFIHGENVCNISALVYYLAASGVGNIICCLDSSDGFSELTESILDLNEDIILKLGSEDTFENSTNMELSSLRIFIGSHASVIDTLTCHTQNAAKCEFIPTIIAINNSWKGFFQVLLDSAQVTHLLESIKLEGLNPVSVPYGNRTSPRENILGYGVLGTLSVIGAINICLGIGELPQDALFFDLYSMEFKKPNLLEQEIFSREFLSETGKDLELYSDTLSNSKVLIVGAGGLGSPAAFALANCGIGTIGLIDYDKVEISNLNRQILHSKWRIGMPKVESARVFLKTINPDINIITFTTGFTRDNAVSLIKDYDVIVDGLDNLPTRYLLNDACYFAGKPYVEAGVIRFDGLNTTIVPGESSCYRCIFPGDSNTMRAQSCAETGVLGPVPGLMGFIESAEVIKLLIKEGKTLKNKLMYFSGEDFEFTTIDIIKDIDCPLCGANPSLTDLGDYNFTCENQ